MCRVRSYAVPLSQGQGQAGLGCGGTPLIQRLSKFQEISGSYVLYIAFIAFICIKIYANRSLGSKTVHYPSHLSHSIPGLEPRYLVNHTYTSLQVYPSVRSPQTTRSAPSHGVVSCLVTDMSCQVLFSGFEILPTPDVWNVLESATPFQRTGITDLDGDS